MGENIDYKKEFDKAIKKIKKDKRKKEPTQSMKTLAREGKLPILKVNNYIENVELFYNTQPFFYDKARLWWLWNKEKTCWEEIDEVDLMNSIDYELGFYGETIPSGVKNSYLEAFKRLGRERKPEEAPIKWIQFKDKVFSLNSENIYDVKPNYFFTNPIPWEIGRTSDTPTIDKLFVDWVGEENKDILYEILAYCCYRDYPIHTAFCLIGSGRNGKTQYQKLLIKFLGLENITSTELDAIADSHNRFETFKLYKKLAAMMGETNFGTFDKSSTFKKLTGGDMISFEKKNKDPFDDYSYAKLLINSNSLPISEDTSEGFYRRWIIIDFPNNFPEGKDIIADIPDIEFNNLCKKVCEILPNILKSGKFTNQGTIEERQKKYIMASNPLPHFIKTYCKEDVNCYVRYADLYAKYIEFLKFNKKRKISKKEFSKLLGFEGFENRRTTKNGDLDFYVEGIEIGTDYTDYRKSRLRKYTIGVIPKKYESVQSVPFFDKKTHQKCHLCGNLVSRGYYKGKPACADCISNMILAGEEDHLELL